MSDKEIAAMNFATTRAPAPADKPDDEPLGPPRFDGRLIRFTLEPDHDAGQWTIKMSDGIQTAIIVLPRGEAHDLTWELAAKLEYRSYELPRIEHWPGRAPVGRR